jgi:hypothetical protein
MNKNEVTPVQIAIRIVIIIIVVVVLLLLSFAMVRLIPQVFSSLSNLKEYVSGIFQGGEKMSVSSNKDNIMIGESATLTYKQTGGKPEGIYTLTYSCSKISSTTHLEVDQNGTKQTVICEDPFYLSAATSTLLMQSVVVTPVGPTISYDQPISITI